MTIHSGTNVLNLAQLTGTALEPLKDIVLPIVGTIMLIMLAVRLVGAFIDEKPGKMIVHWTAAIPVAVVCFFPDTAVDILKGLAELVVGS